MGADFPGSRLKQEGGKEKKEAEKGTGEEDGERRLRKRGARWKRRRRVL